MRIVDLIQKKKENKEHTREEIEFLVNSFMDGTAEDYQISAWLMAVCLNGLTIDETTHMTRAFINSGEILDLSDISEHIVDKHSSGGVGDKITLILIPLLAAAGIKVAKLSGRGLGMTGGTIDKLESIPDFKTNLDMDAFIKQVKDIGCAIASQTKNLTPADAKFYALRDVTATVDNIGLISASIISKKIASGANHIVLDVKCGKGAFIKTKEDAVKLSETMVEVAKRLGKKVTAVISSMDEPLGTCVGNSVEVIESIDFLKGKSNQALKELTFKLAAISLMSVGRFNDENEANKYLQSLIDNGSALQKFRELIINQGGNPDVIDDYSTFKQAKYQKEIKSDKSGFINSIDAMGIAKASKILGAGRDKKSDNIDFSEGVKLLKLSGEAINENDSIAIIYTDKEEKIQEAEELVKNAFEINEKPITKKELIYGIIGR